MSNSLNSSSIASRFLFRIILGIAIGGITLTAMGMFDLAKDAFGSHRNFAYMLTSEYRVGDIVYGTIDETIGCAATSSSTRYSRYGEQIDSYYYVVPIYAGNEDPFPDKLILFKTSKPDIYKKLEDLLDSTIEHYVNGGEKGKSIYIDRAEIQEMTSEEERVFREYVDSFVEAYYEYEGEDVLETARRAYSSAIVPYTIAYTESSAGGIILIIGLTMIGVLILIVLVFIAGSKRSSGVSEGSIYIGSHDPNLNAPTGLENANARYDSSSAMKVSPSSQLPKQPGGLRADYSTSHRPMPPIEGMPEPPRIIRYDPQTGRPVYAIPQPNEQKAPEMPEAPVEMETIDLKNTDLVDTSNGGIDKSEEAVSYQSEQPVSHEMPAIDLKDRSFADLSNGGTDDDAWEARANIAEMPMNGNIPVINPERYHSDAFFGTAEDMLRVTEEEPTVYESVGDDILVQPTDPSQRNNYSQIVGGNGMNSVDLATETSRDLSNGGVESESVAAAMPETKFPEMPAFPTAEEKPAFTTVEEKPAFTTVEEKPAFPTVEEKPIFSEIKQETTDSYNIFKTSGNDYNIFKDPKVADNHMGFPIEDRDQPSLDMSFPTADKKE